MPPKGSRDLRLASDCLGCAAIRARGHKSLSCRTRGKGKWNSCFSSFTRVESFETSSAFCTANMLALAALTIAALFSPPVHAQDQTDQQKNYTVWSSVVLTRTGNRTPDSVRDIPTKLTSVGANQAFSAGSFFRNRYIELGNGSSGIGGYAAPLKGIDANIYSNSEVYASALDQQWNSATATAFLQGFYPSTGGSNTSSTDDLTSTLNNGSYITGPLDGYQYPRISTPGLGSDPMSIYLNAASACESFGIAQYQSVYTAEANATRQRSEAIYKNIGSRLLSEVLPSANFWSFENAYPIYDYARYKYEHNAAAQRQLDEVVEGTNTTYLTVLKELADQQVYGMYGNMTVRNVATGGFTLSGRQGSISTIAGNFLAANIYARLADAVYGTDSFQPLNLLFADYQPFMSFFALTYLPEQNSNFVSPISLPPKLLNMTTTTEYLN